jgi:hypothetical protein
MLILPDDISKYRDVLLRWESVTVNFVNQKSWTSTEAKVQFIENLLGEVEKRIFQQWRTAYPQNYADMVAQGDDPVNVTGQIARIFTLEDPYAGTTEEQDRAYADLERLQCTDIKYIFQYMNQFKELAAKSGRIFLDADISDKFFRKMPPLHGKVIGEAFKAKYPEVLVGVMPRMHFTQMFLTEMCQTAALQRSLKDLSFCKEIPMPGFYKNPAKRYGIRKAKTYKGKPHDSHIRVFKSRKPPSHKCKCFICGEEGHYARECRRGKGDLARAALLEGINLPDDWDVVSVDLNEPDSEGICSASEGEANSSKELTASLVEAPWELNLMAFDNVATWWKAPKVTKEQDECAHDWHDGRILGCPEAGRFVCDSCQKKTLPRYGTQCVYCELKFCGMCVRACLGRGLEVKPLPVKMPEPRPNEDLVQALLLEVLQLRKENEALRHQVAELQGEKPPSPKAPKPLEEETIKKLQKDFEDLEWLNKIRKAESSRAWVQNLKPVEEEGATHTTGESSSESSEEQAQDFQRRPRLSTNPRS